MGIEKLLGKSVPKATVPEELGETPGYNTAPSGGSGGGDRKFNKPRRFQNNTKR